MGARRAWRVLLAVPEGRGRWTYTHSHESGIPTRTYATEAAAEDAAVRLTTPDADGNQFVAARISAPVDAGWPIGEVVEYRGGLPRRFNVIDEIRKDLAP